MAKSIRKTGYKGVGLKEMDKVTDLYDRAGRWETKSKQAVKNGNLNKAGECRTRALKLVAQAKVIEQKARTT